MEIYQTKPEGQASHIQMLIRYRAWANAITFKSVLALPESELTKIRQTHFKTIISTLNHIHVIDDIFRAHLEGRSHGYTGRNTQTTPPVTQLWAAFQEMDAWYIKFADSQSEAQLSAPVEFNFVDGGAGLMSGHEILSHVINHASYHRGFVSDMLYQVPVKPQANDLPVFLRDIWR
ncbi:MAG: DinB family protein [Robiginitomaculum sp.]